MRWSSRVPAPGVGDARAPATAGRTWPSGLILLSEAHHLTAVGDLCVPKTYGRVARGISAPGSHRSVRNSLPLHGSCRPGHLTAGFTQAQ
jgi:hypothetical protein